jgi:hypothetical protein
MSDTYTPRAGSIASRVIDELKCWGPLRTAELAAKLDVTSSSLATNLSWPEKHGAIISRKLAEPGERQTLLWYLPGQLPPEETAAPAVAAPAADQAGSAPAPAAAEPSPRAVRAAYARLIDQASVDLSCEPARFALWNDGALEIRRGNGAPLVLTVDDTRALCAYLERMGIEEAA